MSTPQAGLVTSQAQTQVLAPQLRQGLRLLAMNLADLRQELIREMSVNPVIDDIESTLEKSTVSEQTERTKEEVSDYPDDYELGGEYAAQTQRDTEAMERREKFFENQTKDESLEEHLLAQLPVSDIAEAERPLAELLIADLDADGYFRGSVADLAMVSGEDEAAVRGLLRKISALDPAGCGATTHQECLLAQLDEIDEPVLRFEVRKLIERHWGDMATGRFAAIVRDLKVDRAEYVRALKALRSLDPRPGRAYRTTPKGTEYVNPEVHVVRCADGWLAQVDARSLPEVHVSTKYLTMLGDPSVSAETKAYVRERIAAAHALIDAVERRQETVQAIAQAIFDAQPGFFESGLKGLRPLTMQEIADKVGVHPTTVSRTVRDKYASTPKGVVELRRLFASGVATETGETVARDGVLERLKAIVRAEDKAHPYSDERLSELLKTEGFAVARRTVAKYRKLAGIPGAAARGH